MRAEERRLPSRRLLILLWAGVWVAYGLWARRAGPQAGVDTALYSRWADLLIAHGFNLSSYLQEQSFYIPPFLYLGWIVVVAGLKSMLGASWMTAIVFLNWLSFGVGSYAVLNASRRTTGAAAGVMLAAFLFVTAGDLLIFIPFVLSDLIFWGMASVTLAAGCRLATAEPGDDRALPAAVTGTLLVVFALIFRPTGLPLLAFWAVALVSWFARGPFDQFRTAVIATAAGLALATIAWHAAIVTDPRAWPFAQRPEIFSVLAQEYGAGLLVVTPESTLRVEPALTWFGAIRLTMQKMIYFVAPWQPSYSRAHTLINLAFFLPAYSLTIAAIVNRDRLTKPQRRAAVILMLFVLSVAVFHALLQLDYDHRYRLPALPALIMLAAIGLESLRRPGRLM